VALKVLFNKLLNGTMQPTTRSSLFESVTAGVTVQIGLNTA